MTAEQLFFLAVAGLLITPVVTFLTLIATQAFAWTMSREQRNRDLEDRREVVRQAKLTAEAAALAAQRAETSAKSSITALSDVHLEVKKVGEQATAAYKEANQSNLKIQGLQDVLTASLGLPRNGITETTKSNKDT